jgi:hypothetical protein
MNDRTLRTLTWLLVGAIALIAFAVSFEAISAYAVTVGAFPRPLRWCAPCSSTPSPSPPAWSSWPAAVTASAPCTPDRWSWSPRV